MIKRRWFTLAAFGVILSAAFLATGGLQLEALEQIVPGVWFRQGDLKQYGHCNNVVIEMSDHLVVVDANFPSGAKALMADIKKVSAKPVKYVLLTHHHGDHAYGASLWTKLGAITMAHINVVEAMKLGEPRGWRNAAQKRKDVGELNLDAPELPKETFSTSPRVMEDSTRRLEFHHFGWAHTRGDGFVYLPKERILCTGDAAVNGPYNYTGDGNVLNWPNVIRAALRLKVDRVLPGHGAGGGKEIMTGQIAFFEALRKSVAAGIKKGQGKEEIATSAVLPDSVRNWKGDSFQNQVNDMYNELTQKKPAGEINLAAQAK